MWGTGKSRERGGCDQDVLNERIIKNNKVNATHYMCLWPQMQLTLSWVRDHPK